MKPALLRLVVTALLFAGWIGYLSYLVLAQRPEGSVILSRPQLLVSDLDVVATVPDLTGRVQVAQVLYPATEDGRAVQPGQTLTVTNLQQCRRLPRDQEQEGDVPPDWQGPGPYLLPLRRTTDGKDYEVVPTPSSPGYPPGNRRVGPPRIYPATPPVLAQYHQLRGA
jgi:hypothetical protein